MVLKLKEQLSFSELLLDTGLSRQSLSEYLKQFVEKGIIQKGQGKKGKYQLSKTYKPTEKLSDQEKGMKLMTVSLLEYGMLIRNEKDAKRKEQLLDSFLTLYVEKGVPLMTEAVLTYALNEYVNKKEIEYVGYSRMVKEAIKNWFIPFVENLGLVVGYNLNSLVMADKRLQLTPDCFRKDFDFWSASNPIFTISNKKNE
jgi:DNA-binding HxlR family transcriptional regulator